LIGMPRLPRRLSPVLALFFLAPLVGEFFLGDFPVVLIFLVVAFAPLYGGGALLIREFTRRSGRGWPTMILLGLAYGVFEEGLITQSLFNPNYMDDNLLAPGYVSWLHTGILWLVYVVSLHTFWSISVPISLVEEANPGRRTSPWLGWMGLTVVAVLFVLGSFALYNENLQLNHHWTASLGECVATAVIVILLVVVAFRLPKRSTAGDGPTAGSPSPVGAADTVGAADQGAGVDAVRPAGAGNAAGFVPSGWIAGAVALVGGLIFKAGLIMPAWPEAVAAFLVGPVIVLVLTARWSRRAGWGQEQRLGITGGTLLTYSWAAFTAHSASFAIDLISHVIYALAAIALLYWVARRMHAPEKHEPTPDAR
jgi:hypothetical protein